MRLNNLLNKLWNRVNRYLVLFLVLFLLNKAAVYLLRLDLMNKVGEMQLFLLILFAISALSVKWTKERFTAHYASVFLICTGVKMMAALVYLWPVITGEGDGKVTLTLIFMINYFIYLNFLVLDIVKSE